MTHLKQAPCESAPPLPMPALIRPTLSVVICNHNYARFLQEAIDSALAQEPPCQVIVVDDGSSDGSRRLLGDVDARVEVVMQPNGGQLEAYQRGFDRCTGDVVVFLDADDALLPEAAPRLRRCFGAGVAKAHFRMDLVDASGRALGGSVPASLASGDVLGALCRHGLLYPSAPGSGNAYRRSVLERLFPLPLDAADRVGADFFTIYGVAAFGSVVACEESLGRYRLHKSSASASEQLVFGNAALGNDEAAKVAGRYARLRPWLLERTRGAVVLPPAFLDFSVQKSVFAAQALSRPRQRGWHGPPGLAALLKALWLQPAYSLGKRLGLSVWALLVLVAPRSTARRLARYVCNPASRTA